MNKEVNFEIAKLLKEKGFDKVINRLWHFNGCDCIEMLNKNSENFGFSAPTIAEVLMWLYENYGIWITVNLLTDKILNETTDGFFYEINGKGWEVKDIKYSNEFNSPAEAYEAAITHTLNELI